MRKQARDFRKEEVNYVMKRWKGSESCSLVGVGSVGKSNLIHHLIDEDTQTNYLGSQQTTLLKPIMIDPNMLGPLPADKETTEQFRCWAGYELMMHRLYLALYPLDILGDDGLGLFDFKHVPKETEMPDYIAKRKPCKDFDQFEHLFIQCQEDLRNRNREITAFKNEQQIDKGYFFVLKGVLLYVAEIGKRELDKNKKMNARLRVIFENGTESDLLLRSLSAELYKN